jgi:hypothetical protein
MAAIRNQPFDEGNAGISKRLRVGHHMRLADRHHIVSVEHAADLHLMLDRPLAGRTAFSGQHCLFLVV